MPEPGGGTVEEQPWEEARGPHLPDRLTALPIPTIVFGLLAIGMALLVVLQIRSTSGLDAFLVVQTLIGAIPTVVAFLLPAALFLRHPDAWRVHRLLVVGTVSFGIVEVLQYASPSLNEWFVTVVPPPEGLLSVSPLGVSYNLLVGALSALAPALVARGLIRARHYEDAPGTRRWWLPVAVITLLTGVTQVLGLVNLPTDVPADAFVLYYWLAVVGTVVSLASLFAWAYLAGTAIVGWHAGEEPSRAWGLAGLAGLFVLIGLAINGVTVAVAFFGQIGLPNGLGYAIFGSFGLGYLALLGAFLSRLPDDPPA